MILYFSQAFCWLAAQTAAGGGAIATLMMRCGVLIGHLLYAFHVDAVSQQCNQLTSRDAILVVDLQNCFMEQRPVPKRNRYEVPPAHTADVGGELIIPAGPLQVSGSAEVVPIANDWVAAAASASAQVICEP